MPNGIYIQTEYHGKLIRKIVCNGEERWFIGSNCAETFLTMDACMAVSYTHLDVYKRQQFSLAAAAQRKVDVGAQEARE